MKISRIAIKNFLGARHIDAHLNKPINLFAGANGAGKSSIQEAVRMALTGESVRVAHKKDYLQLVSEGEEHAEIDVHVDGHGVFSMNLPSGKSTPALESPSLPYVLNAQRFASLPPNERRTFLFGLMNLSADGDTVVKKLSEAGCAPDKIEKIRPLLRIDFETAQKEAAGKSREAKGAWRAVTGETYGSKKAEGWAAIAPAVDEVLIAELEAELATTQTESESAIATLAEIKTRASVAQGNAQRIAGLTEKAGRIKRIKEALAFDEAGVIEWTQKLEAARAAAQGEKRVGLVHDLARSLSDSLSIVIPFGDMNEFQRGILREANANLDAYGNQHGAIPSEQQIPNAESKQSLPEYERSLSIYQNAVANGKRNLAAAEAAAAALESMAADQAQATPTDDEILSANKTIADLREHKKAIEKALNSLRDDKRRSLESDDKTIKAANHHLEVQQWELIADQLAPGGIPASILNDALEPINERLETSAMLSTWPVVKVNGDMGILYGNRAYDLLSESEQWRVDAMLAEAIAYLSGEKLLALDRFDVLDLGGREDLLLWLSDLAEDGEIETALIFGTLKGLPANLPENIAAFWVDGGVFPNEGVAV